jgi:hypothetical protein
VIVSTEKKRVLWEIDVQADVRALNQWVPPPQKPRCPTGDWAAVETKLGLRLPQDYMEFIGSYGTGSLQSFLHIWNYLDVPAGTDVRDAIRSINAEYQRDRDVGYKLDFEPYPSPGCLIPFCSTDDGNYLNWRTSGEPSIWCVVAYDCGLGRLIAAEGVGMVKCLLMLAQKRNPFGDSFCNVESFQPPLVYRPPD